jgi:L-ribulose-5-phosphate 4-epimerase
MTQDRRQLPEQAIRELLLDMHRELVRNALVTWTAGNVSARIPDSDLFLIKPSGVSYDELTAQTMVLCHLSGKPLGKQLAPSSDAASHAYIYRHLPHVGGVVHTHSTYATAWAARHEAIPCVLTAMADEFGGEIPCGPFAPIGGEEIGRAVVETLADHRSPAIILANHGVFTIGKDARAAVKAAVMCEDVARTVHVCRQINEPRPIAPDDIDALYRRYQTAYGQPGSE